MLPLIDTKLYAAIGTRYERRLNTFAIILPERRNSSDSYEPTHKFLELRFQLRMRFASCCIKSLRTIWIKMQKQEFGAFGNLYQRALKQGGISTAANGELLPTKDYDICHCWQTGNQIFKTRGRINQEVILTSRRMRIANDDKDFTARFEPLTNQSQKAYIFSRA